MPITSRLFSDETATKIANPPVAQNATIDILPHQISSENSSMATSSHNASINEVSSGTC